MTPEQFSSLEDWVALARKGDPSAYDGPTLDDVAAIVAHVEELESVLRRVDEWFREQKYIEHMVIRTLARDQR